uniref:CHAT domain-containing protein n=1 Tax=Cyanothece sp. (strain PCC 7425 / ATCC 29141) TaxID=395961 RepID=B8HNW4_CYAP4
MGQYDRTQKRGWKFRFRFLLALGLSLLTCLTIVLPFPRAGDAAQSVLPMERRLEKEYEDYFGRNLAEANLDATEIATTLAKAGQRTGTKPAVIWVIPRPQDLHLVLIMPNGQPIIRDLPEARQDILLPLAQQFRNAVANPVGRNYLEPAQQLYRWIISPLEKEYLQPAGIDTLLFCLGGGLRTLPLAALHNGQQFLIENYSLTRIPAFNLFQTDYKRLRRAKVLAMGASEFQTLSDLPAVPIELQTIVRSNQNPSPSGWKGKQFLNQTFTLDNLQAQLATHDYKIVHLATHAEFRPGNPQQSYIQLWDQPLTLNQVQQINWRLPPLELLVLSACKTAIGDRQAELGFAGLALQSGVKSSLASLWSVSDNGTLALMGEFYAQLKEAPIKAEALRRAQLALLKGETKFADGQIQLSRGAVALPPEFKTGQPSLAHPYFWAGFTLISSPW